jgi:sulfur-oxidizing protein SoxY
MIERYDEVEEQRPVLLRTTHSLIGSIVAWLAIACTSFALSSFAFAADHDAADPWPNLAQQIFGKRMIEDGSDRLSLEAPARAEDAAVVPVSIIITPRDGDQRQVRRLTLVIDQNPSPLAARFDLAPNAGIERITTRVRIDDYTNLHAVAELDDGSLLMVKRFVKAAGGCSAPPLKQDQDTIARGTMRFRLFPPAGSEPEQAQLMIRHPNYSGMQMDQLTRLYIPAAFVRTVRIWEGEDELLSIESGISISENPEFRFAYHPNGARAFRAEAIDSDGKHYEEHWETRS